MTFQPKPTDDRPAALQMRRRARQVAAMLPAKGKTAEVESGTPPITNSQFWG